MKTSATPASPWHVTGRLVRLAAIAFVLLFVSWRWNSTTGLTGLMRFGEQLQKNQLAVLQSLPLASSPGAGYDGQFYAQIAVNPHPTDPALVRSLDKPSYRLRRILLPLLAHGVGLGNPWWVLQAYALLNVIAWLALALVLWKLLPLDSWQATVAYCGIVLGVGALDSVRLALTDLPAALLLLLTTLAVERGRTRCAVLWFLAATFTREVSLLSGFLLRGKAAPDGTLTHRRTLWLRSACAVPVLAWCAWLAWRLPGPVGHEGNIDWPGFAMVRELGRNFGRVVAHGYDSQWVFGILGGLGLAAQSLYLLRQWRNVLANPWLSLGLPFAVLFWFIGSDPWIDYRAVARDCLPMTLVFNVLFVRRSSDHPAWLLANIAVIDGVIRMSPP